MSIKAAAKAAFLRGPLAIAQRLRAPRVAILQYHSVQDDPRPLEPILGGIGIAAREFDRQMAYVASTCSPLLPDDLPAMLTGRAPVPRRAVVVTFDDGYRDNVEVAAPILERHGLRGAFYVTTTAVDGTVPWFCRLRSAASTGGWPHETFVERARLLAPLVREDREARMDRWSGPVPEGLMMSWEEARNLRRRGHVVGSHTASHPNLARVPAAEASRELRDSATRLRAELDAESPLHFAYPNPGLSPIWNEATARLCAAEGYATAMTSDPGTVGSGASPMSLTRVAGSGTWKAFRWKLESNLAGWRT